MNATVSTGIGPHGENLIFLISQPRSGSTLLQRILAGHPEVFTTAEPWIMLHPLHALKDSGYVADYNAVLARAALRDFCKCLPNGEADYVAAVRGMAVALYNGALEPSGKRWFLDKTPRYYAICPELRRTFPAARFVFLHRNPLAVLASIFDSWIQDDWGKCALFRPDLLAAPSLLAQALADFGTDAIKVRYEELALHPERAVAQICARLGLDFEPGLLNYGSRPRLSGSMGDQTGIVRHQRPVSDSLEKWRQTLAGCRTHFFASRYLEALDPGVLAGLGYPVEQLRASLATVPAPAPDPTVDAAWLRWVEDFFAADQITTNHSPSVVETAASGPHATAIQPAYQTAPVVEYLEGFYYPEGKYRWMSDAARLRIQPAGLRAVRMTFASNLAACYESQPLLLNITCDGVPQPALSFQGDEARQILELELDGTNPCLIVEFRASGSFVPRERGLNGDTRRLSVKLESLEFRPPPGSAASDAHLSSAPILALKGTSMQTMPLVIPLNGPPAADRGSFAKPVAVASGFHAPEGDFQWMTQSGILQLQIAESAMLTFEMECSEAKFYPSWPLRVCMSVDGKLRQEHVFTESRERKVVRLPVTLGDWRVQLNSSAAFVPAEQHAGPDGRQLSVRLCKLHLDRSADAKTSQLVNHARALALAGNHRQASLALEQAKNGHSLTREILRVEAGIFLCLRDQENARRNLFASVAVGQSEEDLMEFRPELASRASGESPENAVGAGANPAWSGDRSRALLVRVLQRAIGGAPTKARVLNILRRLEPDSHLKANIRDYEEKVRQHASGFETISFLNWYAQSLRPLTYLEIGVRRGRSLAQVLVESPGTQAFGFDLWIANYAGEANPGPEFVIRELLHLGVQRLPAFWAGRSQVTVPLFLLDPAVPKRFELINVDGDHSYKGAREDLEAAFGCLADGGGIVFDDITHPSHRDLLRLWNETKLAHPECLFLEDMSGYGTGVALKPPLERYARVAIRQILAHDRAAPDALELLAVLGDPPTNETRPTTASLA